jgi:hypothetical protein
VDHSRTETDALDERGDIFHYDFWFQGRRYVGTTRQTLRSDATICEQEVKRRVRRQSAGLVHPSDAPRVTGTPARGIDPDTHLSRSFRLFGGSNAAAA